MNIVCLDLEGVLVPEIWVEFAKASGIPELARTTRDEPDYDKLMGERIALLRDARAFLDRLRAVTQVIIVSDTFSQFASPLMEKLARPTIFCNTLDIAQDGAVAGYRMRVEDSKLTTVRGLQSIGYDTVAAGDSHNDLGMIRASKAGFLFRAPGSIKAANPDLVAYEGYDELFDAIVAALD